MSFSERIDSPGFWQAIGRPALAYCVASCTAGLVISLFTLSTAALGDNRIDVATIFGLGAYFVVFVAVLALIPTILAVSVLRQTRLRRGLAEVAVGGLMGFLVSSVFYITIGDGPFLTWTFQSRAALFGVAGAVAGLTYWLVLGRPGNPSAR